MATYRSLVNLYYDVIAKKSLKGIIVCNGNRRNAKYLVSIPINYHLSANYKVFAF